MAVRGVVVVGKMVSVVLWFSVYAICGLNVCIWIAYVGRGRCSSSSMMV